MSKQGEEQRAKVTAYRNCLRISLRETSLSSYSSIQTRAYAVPYQPVGGPPGHDVRLVVVTQARGRNGTFEATDLITGQHQLKEGDLSELAVTAWYVITGEEAVDAKAAMPQPVMACAYEAGETLVACLGGTSHRTFEQWLSMASDGGDPTLLRTVDEHRQGWTGVTEVDAKFKPAETLHPEEPISAVPLFRGLSGMAWVHEGIFGVSRSGPKGSSNAQPQKVSFPTAEQPPYWGKCRNMDFAQLRQFIDDSLGKPPKSGRNEGRPRSKGEFLDLWEMLRGKIGPPEFPHFEPSEQLESLLDQRKQLTTALAAARSDPSATKRSIRKLQRKQRLLEQDIDALGKQESRAYKERREAYLRRRPKRLQIVERIRRDIEHAFQAGPAVPTRRLPWRVLPPGELSVDTVLRHYGRLQQLNPHIRFERDRIIKAFSLRPDQCYVGIDEFEGYMVLTFAHTPRALLECPVFGNAIYIINSDWKRLARLTKQELLMNRSREVNRIVHRGDWFSRVKRELGIR